MPLIKRKIKHEKHNVGARLNEDTAAKLQLYCEYTNVSKAEIIEATLNAEFESNTDFKKYVADGVGVDGIQLAKKPKKKKAIAA